MKNYNIIVSIDEYLIREVLKENETSIVKFVELSSPYIYGGLYKFTQLNRDEIDDLYQTIFLKLFENNKSRIKNWNGNSKFTTYLYMIVINTVRDYLRSSGYKNSLNWVESEEFISENSITENNLDSESIKLCLNNLNSCEQEVIVLYFFQDLKEREIADKLNKPINSISSIKFRALRKIRKLLEEKSKLHRPIKV